MRNLPLLTAFVAAVLLAACDGPAEFAHPLSAPGTTPHDEQLIGRWYALAPEADGVAMLEIAAREDGLLDAAFGYMSVKVGSDGGAGLAWLQSTVHASLIGDQTYYNARMTDGVMMMKESGQAVEVETDPMLSPHPDRGYWIVRGEINDSGVLMLEILSEAQPRLREVPSHDVECGADCSFTVYDLDRASLADFVATGPEQDLFTIRIPFARFGAPPPPLPE